MQHAPKLANPKVAGHTNTHLHEGREREGGVQLLDEGQELVPAARDLGGEGRMQLSHLIRVLQASCMGVCVCVCVCEGGRVRNECALVQASLASKQPHTPS